jgi:hypothetical protein
VSRDEPLAPGDVVVGVAQNDEPAELQRVGGGAVVLEGDAGAVRLVAVADVVLQPSRRPAGERVLDLRLIEEALNCASFTARW